MNEAKKVEMLLELNRNLILDLQSILKDALKAQACVDCGESDVRTLVFDHVRGVKRFTISQAIRKMVSVKELKRELTKCQLRCSNCYLKKHDFGGGEHYYTSNAAIDKAIEQTEEAVLKRFLRSVGAEAQRNAPPSQLDREEPDALSEALN
jgi:hypothetical protein